MNAHSNMVENLVVFSPLVIITHILEMNTATVALLYFFSRLAHAILFILRIPVLRIIAFLGGFTAQMMLVFNLLA